MSWIPSKKAHTISYNLYVMLCSNYIELQYWQYVGDAMRNKQRSDFTTTNDAPGCGIIFGVFPIEAPSRNGRVNGRTLIISK